MALIHYTNQIFSHLDFKVIQSTFKLKTLTFNYCAIKSIHNPTLQKIKNENLTTK